MGIAWPRDPRADRREPVGTHVVTFSPSVQLLEQLPTMGVEGTANHSHDHTPALSDGSFSSWP